MVDHAAKAEAESNAVVPYDSSDPAQVNKARKEAARRLRSHLEVVRTIMSTKQGRAWMYDKLSEAHIWTPSFAPGDQFVTAYKEGERNAGLKLLGDIQAAAPDQYIAMVNESSEKS